MRLQWDGAGRLTSVQANSLAGDTPRADGPLLPAMPNLHSHAFQRALAGLTEYRGQARDSFWSWRTLMYQFANRLDPQSLQDIATWLYIEMLQAGYGSTCEFHYVHHDADGRPYADDATLSLALLEAARRTGMRLTLLPVLYQTAGFGGQPPNDGQRRFIRGTDNMLRLLERLKPLCDAQGAVLGLAPHSLRAVPPDSLGEALAGLDAIAPGAPVHIHIAEQTKEVEDCLAWSGQRPVQWLLDHMPVDARWCLVHATHLDAAEIRRGAASGAVAGLCPTTEANLGDGIFPFAAWRDAGGAWGLGSDSHICVDAAEEILMLEYSQRLASRERNIGALPASPQVPRLDATGPGRRRASQRPARQRPIARGRPGGLFHAKYGPAGLGRPVARADAGLARLCRQPRRHAAIRLDRRTAICRKWPPSPGRRGRPGLYRRSPGAARVLSPTASGHFLWSDALQAFKENKNCEI